MPNLASGQDRPLVLTLNCGSSSVKFALFALDSSGISPVLQGMVDGLGGKTAPLLRIAGKDSNPISEVSDHTTALTFLFQTVFTPYKEQIRAVSHRVVHGGQVFADPVKITPDIFQQIAALTPFAPLHQPHNLAGITIARASFPDTPHIACFDTGFHRTIPHDRQILPLPPVFAEHGLIRYGFHGLSYQSIVNRLPDFVPPDKLNGRFIICHLGNGCSLCGIKDRQSHYTTMGFTPLDGLIMGTRSGRMDPGLVLELVDQLGGTGATRNLLNKQSGLLALSGISADMRILLDHPSPAARQAIAIFTDRLAQEIGAAAAALGGTDGLIFTGGIGENATPVREACINQLAFLGLSADHKGPDVYVIPSDEEAVLASAARTLL